MTLNNMVPAVESRRVLEARVDTAGVQALHDKLDRLLAKAKPNKRELTLQVFRDLYPKLEAHLASGKLLKDVVAAFNELAQAKVCARTFNDMLDQERARRDDAGNPVCCVACGAPLKLVQEDQSPHPQVSGSSNETTDLPPTDCE
jgi:hypothetical protein